MIDGENDEEIGAGTDCLDPRVLADLLAWMEHAPRVPEDADDSEPFV